MPVTEPVFEELYVVSDLHLGGTPGAPIFAQAGELASLVDFVAKRSVAGTTGLVLCGDVIDTLAENLQGYVAGAVEAEEILKGIWSHPAFRPVFDAFSSYVKQERHALVFVLGNHDLELAYPNVQELIRQSFAGGDEAARSRVTFATLGIGFRCAVERSGQKRASVVCVHGNEFDDWNAVAPEDLNRLLRAGTLGKESERTKIAPNAGTALVRDVMNAVKRDHPFVDLLKPEIESVFNVLLALDPKRIGVVASVVKNAVRATVQGGWRTSRVLGEGGDPGMLPALRAPLTAHTEGEFGKFLEQTPAHELSLTTAWALSADPRVTPELLAEGGEVLGPGQAVVNSMNYLIRRIWSNPQEALRAALRDWGGEAETFALGGPCPVFDQLLEIQPDADVVIAGHTHLRRQKALKRENAAGRGPLYLNTGTWIRLLRLPQSELESAETFATFWEKLSARSMSELDELPPDVLLKQRTVAVVRPKGASVEAALCEYEPPGAPGAVGAVTALLEWVDVGRSS